MSIQNFFIFSGRIGRIEFLFRFIGIYIVAGFAMVIVAVGLGNNIAGVVLFAVIALMLFISIFSLFTRRLHDLNLPGWVILILFLPSILGPLPETFFYIQHMGHFDMLRAANMAVSNMSTYIFRYWPFNHMVFPHSYLVCIPPLAMFVLFIWAGTNGSNRYGIR